MGGRFAHGRRGEDERRGRAVAGRDPPQPPEHRRDVRPEHPAVHVALVDDDVLERPQEPRPPLMAGQEGVVEQVGVGEHDVGVVADPAALVGRGVAVVGRGAHAGHGERLDPGELVGRRAPSSARGRSPSRPDRPGWRRPRRPRTAPARGSPGSCPRPSRWRARRAGRPPRGRSRPAGATTAAPSRRPAGRTARPVRRCRATAPDGPSGRARARRGGGARHSTSP